MSIVNRIRKIESIILKKEFGNRTTLGRFLFRSTGESAINFIKNNSIGPYPLTDEQNYKLKNGISPFKILLTKKQDKYLRTPR